MILELKHVTKQFGGLTAINDMTMSVPEHGIKALIGPNGAGKTTAFNLITGVYDVTGGSISFNGMDITNTRPDKTVQLGICRTFQNIRLFRKMSALDNVATGMHTQSKNDMLSAIFDPVGTRAEEKQIKDKSMDLLRYFHLEDSANELASNLPYGHQRILEIARALASKPKLLLLDEPAAGMNREEKIELVDMIRKIRDDFDLSVLLVEHDMSLIMTLAEDITVLNFGTVIANGTPEEIQKNEQVIEAYLGRDD